MGDGLARLRTSCLPCLAPWGTLIRLFLLVVQIRSSRSMFQPFSRFVLVVLLTIAGLAISTVHASPFGSWNPFKEKVSADPEQSYLLTEANGPWTILATTFVGDGAEEEAHALVIDLRKNLNLTAYLHKKRFDYSKPLVGKGVNRFNESPKMRYRKNIAFDEWAVLAGDFESIELPVVKRTLKKIKYVQLDSLRRPKTQQFRGLRDWQRQLNRNPAKRGKGPMGNAFVTRNPLLPEEYFAPSGMDKFVYDLNKDLEYSLLECPRKYTVRVATFRGNIIIDQKTIRDISNGAEMKSRLALAAEKTDTLTKTLRKQGVEAYQFHERDVSIVTVGSFDSVGTPAQNGKVLYHQGIIQLIQQYGPKPVNVTGSSGLQPRMMAGIIFDMQPTAVRVPKYSVSHDYAQAGKWFR